MSTLVVHRRAARYLERLARPEHVRVKQALIDLAAEPLSYSGVIRMVGEWEGYWRIRIGNLRIIFWLDETEDTIYVDHIGPRGDIY